MIRKHGNWKTLFLCVLFGLLVCLPSTTPPPAHAKAAPAVANKALITDAHGHRSPVSSARLGAAYTVEPDARGQTRIRVSGSGAEVTLPMLKTALEADHPTLLQELSNDVWLLNAHLLIDNGVTLNLGPAHGVTELRLRSQARVQAAGALAVQAITEPDGLQQLLAIDYSSFVSLITHDGVINLDGVKVTSWDPDTNTVDTDVENGRAYLLAKYDAALNIRNSDIGYLGSADGESYGVSWRDVNATDSPDVLRTRVTGEVINSKFHHLYYGIYTYQASNMLFRGNQFYQNIRYGFDPHDFTRNVLVEDNVAYGNGAHGFIISRGCNNFTVRNNTSYNNSDPGPSLAHGFMLDPGSPNSDDPQAPSYDNVIENNEAYGNEGYGIRILGSINNEVRNNHFHHNQQGIVVDVESPDNVISQNRLELNTLYGLVLRETADRTTVTGNIVNNNQDYGMYVRSNNNAITENQVKSNHMAGIVVAIDTRIAPTITTAVENQLLSNTISGTVGTGLELRGAQGTQIQSNLIESNQGAGIYLMDEASQNSVVQNIIRSNKNSGIGANGALTSGNVWSENQLYDNLPAGISLTAGANEAVPAPQLLRFTGDTVHGAAGPRVTVELFADVGAQGRFFLGETRAAANGTFSFTLSKPFLAPNVTAVAIDAQGNASVFSAPLNHPAMITPTATPRVTATATWTPTPVPTGSIPTPTPMATATPPEDHQLLLPLVHR